MKVQVEMHCASCTRVWIGRAKLVSTLLGMYNRFAAVDLEEVEFEPQRFDLMGPPRAPVYSSRPPYTVLCPDCAREDEDK